MEASWTSDPAILSDPKLSGARVFEATFNPLPSQVAAHHVAQDTAVDFRSKLSDVQ